MSAYPIEFTDERAMVWTVGGSFDSGTMSSTASLFLLLNRDMFPSVIRLESNLSISARSPNGNR